MIGLCCTSSALIVQSSGHFSFCNYCEGINSSQRPVSVQRKCIPCLMSELFQLWLVSMPVAVQRCKLWYDCFIGHVVSINGLDAAMVLVPLNAFRCTHDDLHVIQPRVARARRKICVEMQIGIVYLTVYVQCAFGIRILKVQKQNLENVIHVNYIAPVCSESLGYFTTHYKLRRMCKVLMRYGIMIMKW
jgi:hypothetical protein